MCVVCVVCVCVCMCVCVCVVCVYVCVCMYVKICMLLHVYERVCVQAWPACYLVHIDTHKNTKYNKKTNLAYCKMQYMYVCVCIYTNLACCKMPPPLLRSQLCGKENEKMSGNAGCYYWKHKTKIMSWLCWVFFRRMVDMVWKNTHDDCISMTSVLTVGLVLHLDATGRILGCEVPVCGLPVLVYYGVRHVDEGTALFVRILVPDIVEEGVNTSISLQRKVSHHSRPSK
jgi:hypothetical protein